MTKLKLLIYCGKRKDWFVAMMKAIGVDKLCDIDYSTDEKEFSDYIRKYQYTVILICTPAISIHDMFHLNYGRNTENILKTLLLLAKPSKAIVVGYDFINLASIYLEKNVDYFIPTGSSKYLDTAGTHQSLSYFKTIIENIVNVRKPNQSIESLILEKTEFYNSVLDIFNERSGMTANTEKEVRFLKDILDKFRVNVVLDCGCGNGRIANRLAKYGFKVYGVDINNALLREAIRDSGQNTTGILGQFTNKNPQYKRMSLTALGFPSGTFSSAIMMWHVICDFKEHQKEVFKEIRRVLINGGLLIFDFPDIAPNIQINPEGGYEDNGNGLVKYRSLVLPINKMLALVESQGFTIISYYRVQWGIWKFVIIAKKN